MSIYKGTTPIAGITTPHLDTRNIGQIIPSVMPLSDAGLHLLDGSLLSGSGSYADFVTYMASMYISNPDLFDTEENWQQSVSDYGVCGKFVYDSVNNTVRLPKLYGAERFLIKSYSSGDAWYRVYSDGWCEQGNKRAAISGDQSGTINLLLAFADTDYRVVDMPLASNKTGNARAGCMLGTRNTDSFVLWQDTYTDEGGLWRAFGYIDISSYKVDQLYQYIVIANSTKTEIEVDIDQIVTDLNGKADKADLDEVQCVVETYSNGTSWYRIWSDGWCEQGGHFNTIASAAGYVVNLLKPYKDVNYNLQVTLSTTGNIYTGDIGPRYFAAYEKTAGSFKLYSYTDTRLSDKDWRAEGYIN